MIQARFNIQQGDFTLDVDLSIADRGVTAIFGPSGSGKTTLLRAMAGLRSSENGFLKVGDYLWQDDHIFVPPHQRSVGYVFQQPSLFTHLDVRRNIEYGLRRLNGEAPGIALERTIDMLGIQNLLDRKPDLLSGGEQQRVAIARALAPNPSMLLLDEPLASLDENLKREILPYLETVHRELEIPVIYVSHSRAEVARLADQIVLLDNGRVQVTGPVWEVFARLDIPLTHESEAETIVEATVSGYEEEFGLSILDFPGGQFVVASGPIPIGTGVRLRILARDVSITSSRQTETSILNIFPVTVDQLADDGEAQMVVRLLANTVPILARITRKSAGALDLKPGDQVFVQIKSVAVLM